MDRKIVVALVETANPHPDFDQAQLFLAKNYTELEEKLKIYVTLNWYRTKIGVRPESNRMITEFFTGANQLITDMMSESEVQDMIFQKYKDSLLN